MKKLEDTLTKGSALSLIRGLLNRSCFDDPLYRAYRELDAAVDAEKERLFKSAAGAKFRELRKKRDAAYNKQHTKERERKTLLMALVDSFLIDGVTKTNKTKLRRILKAAR